ncbi:hypothetical protein TFKS16_2495 [Tannerella forsythia KS16]|uniref:Uncharacterized protein n=1 Tax=Tannerella forsythia (strain ATCC 43037 / JCM 10827 / CCUG 21028 A / KCTC 5666 / FDC 338) TaxID=203275 RepID=G8UMT5_TANFA|nr:hypothetical protein BFO_2767 [Tannerella forsythia 92A2]BAR49859.1 hypothetical protein TF3313_2419 [Tannerella forsythia 3313]BAR52681.1 hypothetical protein TFKS16_2495 [Tannerella forsythia KS16]
MPSQILFVPLSPEKGSPHEFFINITNKLLVFYLMEGW